MMRSPVFGYTASLCMAWALIGCADQSAPGAVLAQASDPADEPGSTLQLGSTAGDESTSNPDTDPNAPTTPVDGPASPVDNPTDGSSGPSNGPATPGANDGDHSTGLPDGLWDWGDVPACADCDPTVFAGTYFGEVAVSNSGTNLPACTGSVEFTITETGALFLEAAECITSTGLSFFLDYDLQVLFAAPFNKPGGACLAGTVSIELPSGDVYDGTFGAAGTCAGYALAEQNEFQAFSVFFRWPVQFDTPSGPSLYQVFLTATD